MHYLIVSTAPTIADSARSVALFILLYAGAAVFSEAHWGRRGLLVSWLLASFLPSLWTMLTLSRVASLMSDPSGRHLMWFSFASSMGFQLVTFGASALAVRFVGGAARTPRPVWVRVCASVVAGFIGAVIATVLLFIAIAMNYIAKN